MTPSAPKTRTVSPADGRHACQHRQIQHRQIQHRQIQHRQIQHRQIQHRQLQHRQIQHRQIQHRPFGRRLAVLGLVLAFATAAAQTEGRWDALRAAQTDFLPLALTLLSELDLERAVFTYPVAGRLSSPFGWRNIAVNGNRFHGGIDLAANGGTPVVVARDGRVTRAGWWGTYGYVVVVDHGDGSETRYAHMRRIDVAAGATVRQGDRIGAVGSTGASTGPHLHFELRFDGRAVDPLPYLEGRGGD